MGDSDNMSVMSEMPGGGVPSVFSGKVTHAERNLSRMDQGRQKEMESLRTSAMSHKEEIDNLKSKLSNSKVRCDVLEKTVKDSKN